ncbi:MAG: 30S ribosomal protein S2 [Patescibacteria group bacterium]
MKIETNETKTDIAQIEKMFEVGAHYAYSRSKRHASTKPFIFGVKNGTEIFDLEKTAISLEEAKNFAKTVFENAGKQMLFVASKNEAKDIVKSIAESVGMPSVHNRWVGGTLTNFDVIKKRVSRYLKLLEEKESGELLKYTKKERLQIDKEIAKLERKFAGIVSMKTLPAVLFVVDSKYEAVAVQEALLKNIPVIALANSDCNIREIDFPIVANDASCDSIKFFTEEIASLCKNKIIEDSPVLVKK